jgi:hypothetical protein
MGWTMARENEHEATSEQVSGSSRCAQIPPLPLGPIVEDGEDPDGN